MSKPLFEDSDDREQYFGKLLLNEDSQFPPYGAAMDHASSIKLGVYSDRNALKNDCAMVMAGEVRRKLNDGTPTDVSELSDEWRQREIESSLSALAHMELKELAYRIGRMSAFGNEFRNCRAMPEYDLAARMADAGIGDAPDPVPTCHERTKPEELVNKLILELIPDWLESEDG